MCLSYFRVRTYARLIYSGVGRPREGARRDISQLSRNLATTPKQSRIRNTATTY